MKIIRIQLRHYWPGFTIEDFRHTLSFLGDEFRFEESSDPDVVFYSVFQDGRVLPRPPVIETRALRVFHTAENVRPDMDTCDYALSFCRDVASPHHLRLPNWIGRMTRFGYHLEDLLRGDEDIEAIFRQKTKFCAFMHRKEVPFRDSFVHHLSYYRPVECAGECLRNVPTIVPEQKKVEYLKSFKFVMAFENESAPGYVTEKLVDAMLARGVGLYWGAPDVHLDFHPPSFLNLADFDTPVDMVQRIVELDRDDEQYKDLLRQAYFRGNQLPRQFQIETIRAFFREMLRDVGTRRPPGYGMGLSIRARR